MHGLCHLYPLVRLWRHDPEDKKTSIDPSRCTGCGACLPPARRAIKIKWNQGSKRCRRKWSSTPTAPSTPRGSRASFSIFSWTSPPCATATLLGCPSRG